MIVVQVAVAAGVVAVALAIAARLRRRQQVQPPTQPKVLVPAQVSRSDFAAPDTPWLVVVFSSATCVSCADVVRKALVLAGPEVAVDDVEYGANLDLHQRYGIDAVPMVLIVDHAGVVRRSFVGPVTATDLWAAVAEARQPGTTPEPELGS